MDRESLPMHAVGQRSSAVARAVRALVRMSIDASDGAYLGAEMQLLAQLGISRPTLRQAAKIVESDQLLEVRRGINGGYFARRPEVRHVVQAPAFYLRLNGGTLHDAGVATELIMSNVAAAAASCPDPDLRAALAAARQEIARATEEDYTLRLLIDTENRMQALLTKMCGNAFLELFVQITYEFGLLERNQVFYQKKPSRRWVWRDLQLAYCDAVLEGDPNHAIQIARRRTATVDRWIKEDMQDAEEKPSSSFSEEKEPKRRS